VRRFLHTADGQIGWHYSQFPVDDAVSLAEARLAAVETVARLAAEHRVDAVRVAGKTLSGSGAVPIKPSARSASSQIAAKPR
jgi:hypothetical protein